MDKQDLIALLKQADSGDAEAQNRLGALFATGGKEYHRAAVYYYAQACKQGHTEAKWNLATMLWAGEGIAADRTLALLLIIDAAENGHDSACKFLAEGYAQGHLDGYTGLEVDLALSEKWERKFKKVCARADTLTSFSDHIDVETILGNHFAKPDKDSCMRLCA
ncbi:Secretory immunoglobulin A-binding protein EsiB [Saezia sanguinis]|jgi:TPR repeat protein|uniref:Secretory immunoglobulin A-binding protein EsiB n=1 Tax=Saezia sanguinis TaxID=1965230 RepID=A0A433SHM9_9BURK|nr:tetratricopeptide repeat protein [Saezia sanguinis]RUS68216.1 Secretory immunoglobulin A-binding protein EsiB [Saezia sanguinis]